MVSMETFEVVQPGLWTTVQDRGRHGYQRFGVPVSGAMDSYSLIVANLLVGNEEGAACLEITLLGPQVRVLCNTVVALTGADLNPLLNDDPMTMWEATGVGPGDIISFGHQKTGCRSYLAVAGGLDVPPVMGSRSTYSRSRLGGLDGRQLRPGDRLRSGQAGQLTPTKSLPPERVPTYQSEHTLRVVLGPQDDHFTEKGVHAFLHSDYLISVRSDRMGCCLEGPPVEHRAGADVVSDGIPAGAVQVPGDGLPIILLADRQTTGGYAKIAAVVSVDLPELAQAEPGQRVRFSAVTEDEAYRLATDYEQTLDDLRHYMRACG